MNLKLITPFKDIFDKPRTSLDLRDHMTAGDVLHALRTGDKEDFVVGLEMVARVAGLDRKDVERMDMRDVDRVHAHIAEIRSPKESAEPEAK
jgi:hypothetical protein